MGAEKAQIAIAWAEHEGPCVARKNRFDIIHCEMCGFRHAVPLPKPADLEREYREDPVESGEPRRPPLRRGSAADGLPTNRRGS